MLIVSFILLFLNNTRHGNQELSISLKPSRTPRTTARPYGIRVRSAAAHRFSTAAAPYGPGGTSTAPCAMSCGRRAVKRVRGAGERGVAAARHLRVNRAAAVVACTQCSFRSPIHPPRVAD